MCVVWKLFCEANPNTTLTTRRSIPNPNPGPPPYTCETKPISGVQTCSIGISGSQSRSLPSRQGLHGCRSPYQPLPDPLSTASVRPGVRDSDRHPTHYPPPTPNGCPFLGFFPFLGATPSQGCRYSFPNFYGLPKLHKTPVAIRPTVSSVDSDTYWWAVWLHLWPSVEQAPTTLWDNAHLTSSLEHLQWPKDGTFLTLEVAQLYTSIQHEDSPGISGIAFA